MANKKSSRKMNKKTFVLNAIHKLRKQGYLGIHVVYSGFNVAFRQYYDEDPIAAVDKLVESGAVIKQPVKGGVMLYDYEEYKKSNFARKGKEASDSKVILEKILQK